MRNNRNKVHLFLKFSFIVGLLSLVFLNSCNPTKHLSENEYLLDKNILNINGKSAAVDTEEIQSIIKQKPNKKVLGSKIYLNLYNFGNRRKKDDRFKTWMRETMGEPPVILDTSLINKSIKQINLALVKKGYFNNHINDSIACDSIKKSCEVFYQIKVNEPYTINSITAEIENQNFKDFYQWEKKSALIKTGDIIDFEVLDDERDRLTTSFQNRGYYYFLKNYIHFDIDSSFSSHSINLTLKINNLKTPSISNPDSLIEKEHCPSYIRNIYINSNRNKFEIGESVFDTTHINGYQFLYFVEQNIKPSIILENVFFSPNTIYNRRDVENTYRRLSSIQLFKSVSIEFIPTESNPDQIDCYILLSPSKKKSFVVSSQGTNSAGNLGIKGEIGFQDKNIFKRATVFSLNLAGGVEVQQSLTSIDVNRTAFNTIEFGPEAKLYFPRFFAPINTERFSKYANAKTVVSSSFNFQQRPDYTRATSNISFGYQWNETAEKKHHLKPLVASLIKIDKTDEFQDRLDELNDSFLNNSYSNHLMISSAYSFTYNNQKQKSSKKILYYRGNVELSGNLLRFGFKNFGGQLDDFGSYEIFKIPFAQFVKLDNEFRYHRKLSDEIKIVYRFVGGVGVPLSNLNVLPFEKSFFAGGSNGLRAWRSRSIGPGSFFDPEQRLDKIGDIHLESNIEYRFDLLRFVEGAFFADAGNIWLLNSDSLRSGAEFNASRFLGELGIGTGFGLRLDFNFFLIRFDLGLQLKNPALPVGERWIFEPKKQYEAIVQNLINDGENVLTPFPYRPPMNFNIGIGYPF